MRVVVPDAVRRRVRGAARRLDAEARTAAAKERADWLRSVARPYWAMVTPLGRGALGAAALAWVLAGWLDWLELGYAVWVCLLALLLSIPFVVGSTVLAADLEVSPQRVFVGTPSAGRLVVRNGSARRLLPLQVDLPVGAAVARFEVPSLVAGQEHEEIFVVPTNRRAVIAVGPASSVQSDPIGLLRREVSASPQVELFVHPQIVAMPSLGSGLLRDLEGQTTRDLSNSDLAFHTLRDYVPGDDRRYVHWRSSAKAGKLLVRQFLDTRRSRVTVVVDADRASYRDEEEFELAMSVAGSLGVRCIQDELDVTVIAAGHAATPSSSKSLLDTLARGELGESRSGLEPACEQAARLATDTSLAVLITGSVISFAELRSGARRFGADVTPMAVRVETDAPSGVSKSAGMTVLAIRQLRDLPRLMTAAAT